MASDWLTMLKQMASQIPTVLMILTGIVIALVRWRYHPRVSMLLVAGLGFMLGIIGGSTFVFQYLSRQSGGVTNYFAWLETLNWIFNLCHAGSIALLILAALVGRRTNGGAGFQVMVGAPPPPFNSR